MYKFENYFDYQPLKKGNTMNKGGFLLASRMLEMASNRFSNNCCNDVDDEMYEGISAEDKLELEKDINKRNDPSGEDYTEFDRIADWWWMSYFSVILKEQK
jgi:hypothetical protein